LVAFVGATVPVSVNGVPTVAVAGTPVMPVTATKGGAVAAACVTDTFALMPLTLTDSSPLRLSVAVLGDAVAVILWFPLPDAGVTVSHAGCPLMLHSTFAFTSNDLLSPTAAKLNDAADTLTSAIGAFSSEQVIVIAAIRAAMKIENFFLTAFPPFFTFDSICFKINNLHMILIDIL